MKLTSQEIQDNSEYFNFLFQLRASGRTNMFDAAPWLVDAFMLEKSEARKILADWMNNFDEIAKELKVDV